MSRGDEKSGPRSGGGRSATGRQPSGLVAASHRDRTLSPSLAAMLLGTALVGCAVEPLPWEIALESAALRERAVAVEARILEGGCAGRAVWSASASRGALHPGPPALDPGRYGVEARAMDASCRWFAGACEEVELPGSSPVRLVLRLTAEQVDCEAAACPAGGCGGADAGVSCSELAGCPECERCEAGTCVPADDALRCASGRCASGRCEPDEGGCGAGPVVDRLAVGEEFTCALVGGRPFCFGFDMARQLGLGGDELEVDLPRPSRFRGPFDDLAAGEHSLFARADAEIWAWGANGHGQLGVGDMMDRGSPTPIGPSPGWAPFAVSVTGQHTCAIDAVGALRCTGENRFGQLGLGGDGLRVRFEAVPGGPWTAASAGNDHTCAIDVDRRLFCWGRNGGRLGNGNTEHASSPQRVGEASDWLAVGAGEDFTCGIRAPGDLHCWGKNEEGQLGLGVIDGTTRGAPARVGEDRDWASLAVGGFFACASKTDGSLHCWGANESGQLGRGTQARSPVPERVPGGPWRSASAGRFHVCALDPTGRPFCWGRGTRGATGQGDRLARPLPSPVCW